ncbi:FAD-binding monooxygenase [Lasiosphaeria hispida]|uniref:FAD-binding monooxygenase n=1 Tax=Lasiosphaeria hispida TaxID=260671 RepID=A0AAJ0HKM7_9PEZI|nr:FAD-binding monooxygenase [Lasiosphaeria hispida]
MPSATSSKLRIAIIGAGPGGLSSAIALSELPDVDVRVYEKAGELTELGGGISVNHNGLKVLELLGLRDAVRGASTNPMVQRNAYTGEIVDAGQPHDPSNVYEARRIRRLVLQRALAARVPANLVDFNKKLASLEDIGADGVRVVFEDGTETTVDLVVGADGIRSLVRKHMYPNYALSYARQVGWRTLIPIDRLKHVPDLPLTTTSWWYGKAMSFWLSPVNEPPNLSDLEFTARVFNEPPIPGRTVSWGINVSNGEVFSRFTDVDPRLVEAFKQVPEGSWREFASFEGPVVDSLSAWDKLALVGDASHPSAGGFGAGSSFAMEDSWILARTIEYTRSKLMSAEPAEIVAGALKTFNTVRRPFYQAMWQFRQSQAKFLKEVGRKEYDDFDGDLRRRFASDGLGAKRGKGFLSFVYDSDIGKAWSEFLESDKT